MVDWFDTIDYFNEIDQGYCRYLWYSGCFLPQNLVNYSMILRGEK